MSVSILLFTKKYNSQLGRLGWKLNGIIYVKFWLQWSIESETLSLEVVTDGDDDDDNISPGQ